MRDSEGGNGGTWTYWALWPRETNHKKEQRNDDKQEPRVLPNEMHDEQPYIDDGRFRQTAVVEGLQRYPRRSRVRPGEGGGPRCPVSTSLTGTIVVI